jgi:hypothetical protein
VFCYRDASTSCVHHSTSYVPTVVMSVTLASAYNELLTRAFELERGHALLHGQPTDELCVLRVHVCVCGESDYVCARSPRVREGERMGVSESCVHSAGPSRVWAPIAPALRAFGEFCVRCAARSRACDHTESIWFRRLRGIVLRVVALVLTLLSLVIFWSMVRCV